jgi:RNA ligase (TIGR02306 family)
MDMILIDEIVSIREIECDSLRYDIEVEDNHNFFANDILVHNCQNLAKELAGWNEKHKLTWEITEKLDGSSMTVYFNEGEFGVCSRNLDLKEADGNSFWKVARELGLEEKMRATRNNMALQGELIGPGIQGNIYNLSKHEFRLFDVFDIGLQEYYSAHDRYMAERALGLEHAPVIDAAGKIDHMSMDDILFFAEGKSKLCDAEREGVVFKCNQCPDISFKSISNKYLLGEK